MGWIRKILLGALLLGALLFLAIGPRPQIDSSEEGVVVIRYWEKWGGGNEARVMQQIVDRFNAERRRNAEGKLIRVEYLGVSGVDMKVLLATSADVPPEVAGVWDYTIPSMGELGALRSFEDLLAERNAWVAPEKRVTVEQLRESYKPIFWEACSHDGELYALCTTPWVTALHWNKELFAAKADELRAAGLDPNRAPRTIDELDRYADILYEIEDGRIVTAGYMPSYPAWLAGYIVFAFDGRFYDPQTNRMQYDTPEMRHMYTWVRGYTERYGLDMINAFQGGVNQTIAARDPFVAGKLAMFFSGPWVTTSFEDYNPKGNRWRVSKAVEMSEESPLADRKDNYVWGAAPFPSLDGEKVVGYASANVLIIPRGAKHSQEAFEFVMYVNERRVMERLCSGVGMPSPFREVSDDFYKKNLNPYIDVYERVAMSPHVGLRPDIPILPELRNDMEKLVQKVYMMSNTPEDALRHSQEKLQRSLDRFFASQAKREAKREAGG